MADALGNRLGGLSIGAARGIAGRLYGDYLLPSRLREYELLLSLALGAGYETLPLGEFAERRATSDRVLLLRHDIDSDLATATRMWEIEQRLGMRGTWFFRLSTWDDTLVAAIAAGGSEVGYHYEELATLALRNGARSREAALALVEEARDLMRVNTAALRRRSGLPLTTFASHGDFANRHAGVRNTVLLDDEGLRAELDVRLEAYDQRLHLALRRALERPRLPASLGTRRPRRGASHGRGCDRDPRASAAMGCRAAHQCAARPCSPP